MWVGGWYINFPAFTECLSGCIQRTHKGWKTLIFRIPFRVIIIIIIIIFLHGLGRFTYSGIDVLPSFPGTSTISSSSGFEAEGVFQESVVIYSLNFVCIWFLHLVFQGSLVLFFMISLLILSSLVYLLTLLRKRISAASRRVMSLFVVTHVSIP